jgi:hypothetical protein
MSQDYRISLYIVFVSVLVVCGVSFFPALTTKDTSGTTVANQVLFEAVFSEEFSYCQASPEKINCRCFAKISGMIQSDITPKVRGVVYADKQELARWQAAGSC